MQPTTLFNLLKSITTKVFNLEYIYDGISIDDIYSATPGSASRDIILKHLDLLCDVDFIRMDDNNFYYPTSLAYCAVINNDINECIQLLQRSALQIKLLPE